MKTKKVSSSSRRGFSMVEVVIAIGIVGLLLAGFVAVFGPAQRNMQRAFDKKTANRLAETLSHELKTFRKVDSDDGFTSAFDKALNWVSESEDVTSSDKSKAVFLYQYKGSLRDDRNADDGTYAAFSGDGVVGQDYVLTTVVRRGDSPYINDELQPDVVVGRVYAVRMRQLVVNTTTNVMELGTRGEVSDPEDPGAIDYTGNSVDYPQGYIAFQAEMYVLNSNQAGYVLSTSNGWDWTKLGNPIYRPNMGVSR